MPSYAVSQHTEYVLERNRWEAKLARAREHQETDEADRAVAAPAADDFWGHVDARIEHSREVVLEAVGEVIGSERRDFQAALDRRDRELKLLRREVRGLRAELELKLAIKAELAAARTEIEQLRRRAPNFEFELAGLREQVDKQARLITRLRGQACQLEFGQKQLDAAQRKDHREVTLTAVQLATFGKQTREVLERLRDGGIDFEEWLPSGPAS